MASPPTPDSWIDGDPRSWGPVEEGHRLRVQRVADLVARRLGKSVGEVVEMLLATPSQRRYLLLRRLGRTGHSTVYGAVDQLLAREVALKLHHDERGDDGDWRVLAEARMMSLVEHPNVVRVFDLGVHEGTMYSVTELCESDMATWAKGRAWVDVVDRIIEAGRGLAALHAAGFVHGDVKPANLLIRDGAAKVADFGMTTRAGLTTRVGGTAGYIAPEAAAGRRFPASDVFALAATAWACLFGRSAFGMPPQTADRLEAIMVLLERALENAIEEPPASAVPRRVVSVLRRGLAPNAADRPPLDQWLAQLAGCRPLAVRWREAEAPRASSVALVGCVLVMLGAGGHAAYSACTDVDAVAQVEPSPPRAPEPVLDVHAEMVAAAENDDPFAVWALYWTAKEYMALDAEQLLAVATILLLDAESGAASNTAASAEIARRLAAEAGRRGWAGQERELIERSEAVVNHSK